MSRRKFLVGSAAATSAALLASPAVRAQPAAVTWRLQSSYPKSLEILYGACTMFSERIAELTDGRFDVKVYAAGELVPPFQVLEGVRNGTVEAGQTASYYWVGQNKAHAFDTTLPFGLSARQQNAWVFYGGGLKLLRDFYAEQNMVNFPGLNTAAQMGGWFRKQINSLEDLKGLRMRIPGMGGEVLSKLGVVPQTLAAGDVYTALEKGTIDATEWVGPYDDEKLGFYRVAKNYYAPGFWEGSANVSFFANKEKLDALPKAFRSAFEVAAQEVNVMATARYDAANAEALRRLVSKGAAVRTFPRDVLQEAFKVSEALLDEEAAKNATFKKLLDSWRPFRETQSLWSRVNELQFANFMAQAGVRR